MTDQLTRAFEAAQLLPDAMQDEIAEVVMQMAGATNGEPYRLSEEERGAVRQSVAAAARGEFASDAEMTELFARFAR